MISPTNPGVVPVRHAAVTLASPSTLSKLVTGFWLVGAGTASAFAVRATGRLTLAGQTRTVTATLQGSARPDGKLRFTGQLPVTMSDYGIKPPTAMMGTLKTGDAVVVHLDLMAALAGTQ